MYLTHPALLNSDDWKYVVNKNTNVLAVIIATHRDIDCECFSPGAWLLAHGIIAVPVFHQLNDVSHDGRTFSMSLKRIISAHQYNKMTM
jgi:hypothetical protein